MLGDILYSTEEYCKNSSRDDSLILLSNKKNLVGRVSRNDDCTFL